MRACVRACVRAFMSVCVCVRACVHACVLACVRARACVCMCTCVNLCYVRWCKCARARDIVRAYVHTCVCKLKPDENVCLRPSSLAVVKCLLVTV